MPRTMPEQLRFVKCIIAGGNEIGAEGAKAIAASLPGLTSLDLGGNEIGAEGAKAIAASMVGQPRVGRVSSNI